MADLSLLMRSARVRRLCHGGRLRLDDIPFEASRLMPLHILGTLQWLGRLAVGPDDDGRAIWIGTDARVFQSWSGGKSVSQVLASVQSHLEEHRLALKACKADTQALVSSLPCHDILECMPSSDMVMTLACLAEDSLRFPTSEHKIF